ncbi:PqqD family protein [Verrucomicrobium spinosum]|uniref:PqqD family protein n=1 Tax=Verrucomicrobium spinosum TaxID=2736 RepID=UPI00094665A6|nr:PqqD family protein [Verrucomicrobium spinosum]
MSPRYRLNEPDVSAEVFDEEVLAINLKTGHYHSLRESSIFLWQTLMQGFSIEETASRLTSKYPEIAAQALAETETFAKHLVEGGWSLRRLMRQALQTCPLPSLLANLSSAR